MPRPKPFELAPEWAERARPRVYSYPTIILIAHTGEVANPFVDPIWYEVATASEARTVWCEDTPAADKLRRQCAYMKLDNRSNN